MSTITFITKDKHTSVTVKEEFIKVCPDYKNKRTYELLYVYDMSSYLHNENGPAVISLNDRIELCNYYLDGKKVELKDILERL